MPDLDDAYRLLGDLVAACESGDLSASPAEIAALRSALVVLDALRKTTV